MAWRFSKSFSPVPGVRMTLSRSGITTSVGVGPIRLSAGSRGAALTARIPGTGLSYHQKLSGGQTPRPGTPLRLPTQEPPKAFVEHTPFVSPSAAPGMREIRSAAASVIASPGLTALKETLATAHTQFVEVERELNASKQRESEAVRRHENWSRGWLFRKLFKKHFAVLGVRADEARSERAQLDEMLEQSRVDTHFDMPDSVLHAYARLVEAFEGCMSSKRIWDNVAYRHANQVAERTAATRIVDLKPVTFKKGQCGVINSKVLAPRLQNVTSGDLYLYPGFLVYMVSETTYALIELTEIDMEVSYTKFHEEGPVPSDAEQVGTTWAKVNKDGSPDRRFKDNHSIPVMRYAKMNFSSARGLNEEYMLSNVLAADEFERSWNALVQALKSASPTSTSAPEHPAKATTGKPGKAAAVGGVALLAAYVLETDIGLDTRAIFSLPEDAEPSEVEAEMFGQCPPWEPVNQPANAATIVLFGLDRFLKASDLMYDAFEAQESTDESLEALVTLFPPLDKSEELPEYLERVKELRERIDAEGKSKLAADAVRRVAAKHGAQLNLH